MKHKDGEFRKPRWDRNRFHWLVFLVAVLVGISGRDLYAAKGARNPNVVVLRSERLITLSDKMTLPEMAAAFRKGSGYTFTLDPKFEKDNTEFALFLHRVPLTRVLQATSYMVKGRWVRTGTSYHLKPLTIAEMTSDLTQYEAFVDLAFDYLKKTNLDDPSLSQEKREIITRTIKDYEQGKNDSLMSLPSETMKDWQVSVSDQGFSVQYSYHDPNTGMNYWKNVYWRGYR